MYFQRTQVIEALQLAILIPDKNQMSLAYHTLVHQENTSPSAPKLGFFFYVDCFFFLLLLF